MTEKPLYPFEVPFQEEIIGRQVDTQAIIELFKQKSPIVMIHGLVGIGKSAVAKRVGLYMSQREAFRDGVMYFSMRDRVFVNDLNFKMHAFIFQKKPDLDEPILQTRSSSRVSHNSGPIME